MTAVRINVPTIEDCKERLIGAVRRIFNSARTLRSAYNANRIRLEVLKQFERDVTENSVIINKYRHRPGLAESFNDDLNQTFPAEASQIPFDVHTGMADFEAAVSGLMTYISGTNWQVTMTQDYLTQADLDQMDTLLTAFEATVDETDYTFPEPA